MTGSLTIRVLNDFDICAALQWNKVVAQSPSREVFLTWEWLSTWWKCSEREQLLLIAVERDHQTIAIAPLFADSGMIFFVGSGGSDYLDFIGDISDPEILDGIVESARGSVPDFCGFLFYHVPDDSPTGALLRRAAARLGYDCVEEGHYAAPYLPLVGPAPPEQANKTSLRRHESFFSRSGELKVEHLSAPEDIRPHLEDFFRQHIQRWAGTSTPSLFLDQRQRTFYAHLTEVAAASGLVRFTRILWDARPIAHHYGFCYAGSYLWYKPAFDIELAKRSPGQVLLRQLLMAAASEGAIRFDFGLGDEPFKSRFAGGVRNVRNLGLYPKETRV